MEGYAPPNREVNHECSSCGSRKQKRGTRKDQGEGKEKSQGKSYAPGVENNQRACHVLSCAPAKVVC